MQLNDTSKVILLAEDDVNDAAATEMALRSAGILNRVIHVSDGDEALAYLKGDGVYSNRKEFPLPSIVLLDLKMPRMDGFRVLSWFTYQTDRKKFLVIVLSGHGELQHIKRAYELGANSFLIKPFQTADIHNLVRVHRQYWTLPPEVNQQREPLSPR